MKKREDRESNREMPQQRQRLNNIIMGKANNAESCIESITRDQQI